MIFNKKQVISFLPHKIQYFLPIMSDEGDFSPVGGNDSKKGENNWAVALFPQPKQCAA